MSGPVYLVVRNGPAAGRSFPIGRAGVRIGRDPGCEVVLPDKLISKLHAEVQTDLFTGDLLIRDLGSKNGVRVNGEPTLESPLRVGDEVRIGKTRLMVLHHPPGQPLQGASEAMQALGEMARLVTEGDALDYLEAMAARLREAANADAAAISVYEEGVSKPLVEAYADNRPVTAEMDALSERAPNPGESTKGAIPPPDVLAPLPEVRALVAEQRRSVLIEDARAVPEYSREAEVVRGHVRMTYALPLMASHQFFGVAQIFRPTPGLEAEARAAAEIGAAMVAMALERSLRG